MAKTSKLPAAANMQPGHPDSTQTSQARKHGVKACADPEQEAHLVELANSKFSQLDHCKDGHADDCPCTGSSGGGRAPAKVDLIILVDTSGSMGPKAAAINDAAMVALDRAKKSCNVDLQATWLGLGGVFNGTQFNQTCQDLLDKAGFKGQTATPGHPEEGADAIADLSNCSNIWREGACRTIFYISDEPLDLGAPQNSADTAAAQLAIAAALANNVKLFAHLAPGTEFSTNPATIQDFTDLCTQTGGEAFIGNPATVEEYEKLLEKAVCQACGNCVTLELPTIAPCFSVTWGDSACDCMETNDFERLLIKACNCYSNVAFHNLMIGKLIILDNAGNEVLTLPDGTPSVEVIPSGPICFGELGPCSNNTPSCKAREIVIRTRGAVGGNYQLKFENICFEVVNSFNTAECFTLKLCKD